MGGAGGLAGGGAGVVAVDAVFVPVVHRPLLRAPGGHGGVLHPGVLHRPVLGAQLLAQLHRARGAELHTAAAGHTVLGGHVGHIGRAAQVGGVEHLAQTQRVADVHVAVADGEDLVLAVNVGDLVHEAVVLGPLQDAQHLVVVHIVALFGLHQIVRHVAHADAPVFRVVAAALAQLCPAHAAAAGAGGVLAVVLFQPVADVLDVHRLVLGLDGLLHRDDVHADARAPGGYHGGDVLQGQEGHPLKEGGHLRVLLDLVLLHVEELGAARHEHGQNVLLFMPLVLPVVFQKADVAHLIEQRFQLLGALAGGLHQLGQGHGLADLHLEGHVRHLVGHKARQTPVLRVVAGDPLQFGGDAVGDFPPQFQYLLPGLFVPGNLKGQLALVQGEMGLTHGRSPFPFLRPARRALPGAASRTRRPSPRRWRRRWG